MARSSTAVGVPHARFAGSMPKARNFVPTGRSPKYRILIWIGLGVPGFSDFVALRAAWAAKCSPPLIASITSKVHSLASGGASADCVGGRWTNLQITVTSLVLISSESVIWGAAQKGQADASRCAVQTPINAITATSNAGNIVDFHAKRVIFRLLIGMVC